MARRQYTLTNFDPGSLSPDSVELAKVIINRIGLMPRKKGSTEDMHKTLIELYERTKQAAKEKDKWE